MADQYQFESTDNVNKILGDIPQYSKDQAVKVSAEQLAPIDGDDQAPYRIVIEGAMHEDGIAALLANVSAGTLVT